MDVCPKLTTNDWFSVWLCTHPTESYSTWKKSMLSFDNRKRWWMQQRLALVTWQMWLDYLTNDNMGSIGKGYHVQTPTGA